MDLEQIHSWYETYKVGIYRYALSIIKDPAGAEDVLQETFLRLLQADSLCFEPGKEKAWLYRVARNLCYDILRARKREGREVREICGRSELEFMELIAPLKQTEREIVSLKILGNMTHREIAAVMKLTEQGTKKRYERAIKKLKEGM